MTMPTFEPVAMRSIVLNRANKLAANSNFYIDGFEAHKLGNLVQAMFETIESQLQQAYEAGLRDAVPEGHVIVPIEPTIEMIDGAKRFSDVGAWKSKYIYKAMLAAAPKGEKE